MAQEWDNDEAIAKLTALADDRDAAKLRVELLEMQLATTSTEADASSSAMAEALQQSRQEADQSRVTVEDMAAQNEALQADVQRLR